MAYRQHKLFYGSSYDRGLDILLFMWPDVLEKYPDATLDICYGWDLFVKANGNNPERMQWKKQVENLMNQDGIVHHGRVGKEELAKIRQECGIWAYPTWFPEINCITALDAQADGLVPVTINDFALAETVGSGIKIDGDIKDLEVQEKFLEELLDLMGDKKRWQKESTKAKKFAKNYTWDKIAKKWAKVFEEDIEMPRVTVYTPVIREGFWRLMAESLSKQSYKDFLWLIVDDYKGDREDIADSMADKYNLDVCYIRGDKAKGDYKRKRGLKRANNLAWKNMEGEILIALQDFITIPEWGIESIVDLYRHNKDALIAPVDTKWAVPEPDLTNDVDWWPKAEEDIFKQKTFDNARKKHVGIRESNNPYEFEMNYGAIPKHILDHLNGWWEFFDSGIGYDNVEIAARAMQAGFRLLVDDTNVCRAVDMPEAGNTNHDNWKYLVEADLDPVRDEKLDVKIYQKLNGSNNS